MKGKLVVIEGIDGAGKDTQIARLASFLKGKDQKVKILKYPDREHPIGSLIRDFLLKKHAFTSEVQFLLYAADMLKDQEQVRSCLDSGIVVICNRYITSTLAYQGAQGFPLEKGLSFLELFPFPKPDLILFLKISPSTGFKRKKRHDRFESDLALQEKISRAYETLIQKHVLGKWTIIDGEQSRRVVFKGIHKLL